MTVPHCQKCQLRRQECQGYQLLFRWEKGVASRGKMRGMTFEGALAHGKHGLRRQTLQPKHDLVLVPIPNPVDPLYQGLSPQTRLYLNYCMFSQIASLLSCVILTAVQSWKGSARI